MLRRLVLAVVAALGLLLVTAGGLYLYWQVDYAISARRPVTAAQMTEILAILQDAPKPVLVHCQSGSDRAGLVTALYLLSRGEDPATAEQALSLWRYGHFPYLGNKTQAMDDSFHTFVSAMEPRAR